VTGLALCGWALAVVLGAVVVRLRTRLELVARAEHELRGPLTAFGLVLESARRGRPVGEALDAELERARAALADLTCARRGARSVRSVAPRRFDLERMVRSSAAAWGGRVEWRAGRAPVVADTGRVAQAMGNLLANAAEHGGGEPVAVQARRVGAAVQVEVRNAVPRGRAGRVSPRRGDRGRGLAIAAAASESADGRLSTSIGEHTAVATLELPVAP
jgi:signal transduction histidine kinase